MIKSHLLLLIMKYCRRWKRASEKEGLKAENALICKHAGAPAAGAANIIPALADEFLRCPILSQLHYCLFGFLPPPVSGRSNSDAFISFYGEKGDVTPAGPGRQPRTQPLPLQFFPAGRTPISNSVVRADLALPWGSSLIHFLIFGSLDASRLSFSPAEHQNSQI